MTLVSFRAELCADHMETKTEAAAVKLAAKATASLAAITALLQGTTHSVRWPRGAAGIRHRPQCECRQ